MTYQSWTFQPKDDEYQIELKANDRQPLEPNQVRIAVKAASLNYRDLIALRNKAGRKVAGRIPCSDGAGEIIEIGSAVKQWRTGDRVAGIFFQTWQSGRFELRHHKHDLGGTIDGMLSQEVVLDENGIVSVPDYLSYPEAASLPCAAVTAWQALIERGNLQPGSTVLALGTGGVSIFALQIALAMKAKVIITSSSDEKIARAKSMGASAGVNYKKYPKWHEEVWKLTQEQGADHVIETGGPGTMEGSMNSIAASGQIAAIGVLTGFGPPSASLFPLLARNVRLDGIYVGSRQHFTNMNAFLELHQIKPVIDKSFSFEKAAEAFLHLESGSHFGKIVIEVVSG